MRQHHSIATSKGNTMTNSNALAVRVREYFDANPNALVSDVARLFGITVNHAKRILMSGG
jgi:hypothetical protein